RNADTQGRGAERRPGRSRAGDGGRGRRQDVLDRHPRLRGLPVITLGRLSFNGPFLAPLWSPPKRPRLYAVLVPGWSLLSFSALYFGQAERFDPELVKTHARHP